MTNCTQDNKRKLKTQQSNISLKILSVVMLSVAFTMMLSVVMLNDVCLDSSFLANPIFVSLAPLNAPLPGLSSFALPIDIKLS